MASSGNKLNEMLTRLNSMMKNNNQTVREIINLKSPGSEVHGRLPVGEEQEDEEYEPVPFTESGIAQNSDELTRLVDSDDVDDLNIADQMSDLRLSGQIGDTDLSGKTQDQIFSEMDYQPSPPVGYSTPLRGILKASGHESPHCKYQPVQPERRAFTRLLLSGFKSKSSNKPKTVQFQCGDDACRNLISVVPTTQSKKSESSESDDEIVRGDIDGNEDGGEISISYEQYMNEIDGLSTISEKEEVAIAELACKDGDTEKAADVDEESDDGTFIVHNVEGTINVGELR